MGYPTPNDAPNGTRCIQILVPAGEDWERLARGALAALFIPENFEILGYYTPEETADVFNQSMFQAMAWETCGGGEMPILGEIRIFANGPVDPTGWLACDGALYTRVSHPDLSNILGTLYGGDVDSFNVPDLRGRAPIGVGSGPGLTPRAEGDSGGEESHVLTEGEMPSHHHALSPGVYQLQFQSGADRTALRSVVSSSTATTDVGGDGAHENMPPFLAIRYYIYAGV